jgi:hypothetical protein
MTLLFGNLATAFVTFGTTAAAAFQPGASPAAMAALADAAQTFRNTAAQDALYLVCIGTFGFFNLGGI